MNRDCWLGEQIPGHVEVHDGVIVVVFHAAYTAINGDRLRVYRETSPAQLAERVGFEPTSRENP